MRDVVGFVGFVKGEIFHVKSKYILHYAYYY